MRLAAGLLPALLLAQQSALLNGPAALEHYGRMTQLMESTTAAVPGLARAGAPVIENFKQSVEAMRTSVNATDAGLHYSILINARGYMALADALPKPHPFPQEATRQFDELRHAIERTDAHLRALMDSKERQLRNPDRDNLRRYQDANGVLGPPPPGKPRVVFLGDSITDGWRLNEYFPGKELVNRGISGQTTGQMLGRMMADVVRANPAAVVLLAGTNDIARGVPMQAIQDNIRMICEVAAQNRIKMILASVLPIHDYNKDRNPNLEVSKRRPPDQIKALNQWIQTYARAKNYFYLDYFAEMVDPQGFLKKELADDGLHPNAAGYQVMAPLAAAAIEKTTFVPVMEPPAKKKRLLPFGGK